MRSPLLSLFSVFVLALLFLATLSDGREWEANRNGKDDSNRKTNRKELDPRQKERAEWRRVIRGRLCTEEDLTRETLKDLDECRRPKFVDLSQHNFHVECREEIMGEDATDLKALNEFRRRKCGGKGDNDYRLYQRFRSCIRRKAFASAAFQEAIDSHLNCYAKALQVEKVNGKTPPPDLDSPEGPSVSDE